jgi:hypothetical protein
MKRILWLMMAFLICTTTFAQENERKRTPIGGRPDIKGDLLIDIGFNTLNNKPEELNTRFIPSRTFNIYYQHPINLFGDASGFTFNPGFGFATDKLAFTNNRNLFNNPEVGPESSRLAPISEVYGANLSINRNNVGLTHFEVPLELRYHFNKRNYNKSVRVALGGKVGYLLNAQTKIAYSTNTGLERQIKDRQSYGFSPIRYGVYTRLGFPGFNLWAYYGLNEVFRANQGPFNTQASHLSFGVSFALF